MLQSSMVRTLVFAALAAVTASMWLATTVHAAPPVSAAASARAVLSQAVATVHHIAGQSGGSYARVGLLNLHKFGLIPIEHSSTRAFVSSASGTAHSFSVSVTAEPSGQLFTVTR